MDKIENKCWDNISIEEIQNIKKVEFLTNTYYGKYSTTVYKDLCENMIIGKTYNVIEYIPNNAPNGRFRLEDGRIYPKELFITIEESRNKKLNSRLDEVY